VLDTDLGMADLNLLLGVAPERSLLDALGGTPSKTCSSSAHGIELLAGAQWQLRAGDPRRAALASSSRWSASWPRTSTPSSSTSPPASAVHQTKLHPAPTTDTIVVVVNPEPLSMADAYACLKVLSIEHGVSTPTSSQPGRGRAQADESRPALRSIWSTASST
jgi:flagellar biosynthesis protein FlhG